MTLGSFNPGSHRTTIRGLIVRIRDGVVLAKTPNVEYARKRLAAYGDEGTVEVRECTDAEAREVENVARPGSMRARFTESGPKRQTRTAKLTDDNVREIRKRLSGGASQTALAAEYNVGLWVISNLKARRTYTDVH